MDICFFIAIANTNKSALLNFLRILFTSYIGLIVILFTTYHTVYVFYKAPNSISTFYSKQIPVLVFMLVFIRKI